MYIHIHIHVYNIYKYIYRLRTLSAHDATPSQGNPFDYSDIRVATISRLVINLK